MKTISFFLILALIVGCNSEETQYVISGSFKNKQAKDWIYLIYPDVKTGHADSAEIIDGRFEFSDLVEVPEMYYLSYNPNISQEAFGFFLEPSELKITIDPSDWTDGSTISGGPINDEFFRMEAELANAYSTRLFEISDTYPSSQEENRESYNRLMLDLRDSIATIRKDYTWNNPDSPISLIYLNNFYHKLPLEELGKILNRIPENMQQTSLYERVAVYYELSIDQKDSRKHVSIKDEVAIINELPMGSSIIGTLVSRNPNKVLYIDIWGTWCGPCKQEFPHSNRLHEMVDTSNVAFIYLCAASEEESWRAMIEDEKLSGQHYFLDRDLERALFKEIGGQRYYPRYLIINKSGKIENSAAPRPSSQEIEKLLADLSN